MRLLWKLNWLFKLLDIKLLTGFRLLCELSEEVKDRLFHPLLRLLFKIQIKVIESLAFLPFRVTCDL